MLRHTVTPDAWQTKVQNSLWAPFPIPWIGISLVIYLIGFFVMKVFESNMQLIRFVLIESLLIAAIANVVIFFEQLLDEFTDSLELLLDDDKHRIKNWIDRWYDNIFWSKYNLLVGGGLAALTIILSIFNLPALFKSWPGLICGISLSAIIGFLGGSMLWSMIGIARLMLSLGKRINIRASIFDTTNSPLRAASSVLFKVSITAVLIFVLGLTTYHFCSIKLHIVNIVVNAIIGLFLILYFIIPQINIHKTLVKIKQDRLNSLVAQIDRSFDFVTKNPNPENIAQLRELFDIQRVVNGKRSWSFGTNELLVLISSILIPLTLFLVKYLFQD